MLSSHQSPRLSWLTTSCLSGGLRLSHLRADGVLHFTLVPNAALHPAPTPIRLYRSAGSSFWTTYGAHTYPFGPVALILFLLEQCLGGCTRYSKSILLFALLAKAVPPTW